MGLGKTEGMQKAFKAGAAIGANRIIQFGDDDDHVIQATAATDGLIGVSQHAAGAAEDSVRVMLSGITDVVYGAAAERGDLLTADADGKAVKAEPAAGANHRVIGIAGKSGVADDLAPMLLCPMSLQGANAG